MTPIPEGQSPQERAKGLLADIQASPELFIPRREAIVYWLSTLLVRSKKKDFEMESTDEGDLVAVNMLLRNCSIPIATVSV